MTIGYCEKCGQNTLLKREDMDICLAIILAIFTAGFGLIIYLIIWYSKEENICVHCGTVATPVQTQVTQTEKNILHTSQQAIDENRNPYKTKGIKAEVNHEASYIKVFDQKAIYCPFCGVKLDNDDEFCPDCGMKV